MESYRLFDRMIMMRKLFKNMCPFRKETKGSEFVDDC